MKLGSNMIEVKNARKPEHPIFFLNVPSILS